jgi:GTP-binding protein Era
MSSRAGTIAIIGRPSVGKSTLLNQLVGQKLAITCEKPQTTRHRISGILTEARTQFVFVDTPGFQTRHHNALNHAMNQIVRSSLAEVDVVLLVVEAGRFGPQDRAVLDLVPEGTPVVVAANKTDRLADRTALLPFIEAIARERSFAAIVPVIAEGRAYQMRELKRELRKALPVGAPLYDKAQVTDRDERFFAAEFVRERLTRLLGDELPHSLAVSVDRFEQAPRLRRIELTAYVARESHKGIVVGRGGERLKAAASAAREDLEALYGGPVFLKVWVRVRTNWADDAAALRRFGYA